MDINDNSISDLTRELLNNKNLYIEYVLDAHKDAYVRLDALYKMFDDKVIEDERKKFDNMLMYRSIQVSFEEIYLESISKNIDELLNSLEDKKLQEMRAKEREKVHKDKLERMAALYKARVNSFPVVLSVFFILLMWSLSAGIGYVLTTFIDDTFYTVDLYYDFYIFMYDILDRFQGLYILFCVIMVSIGFMYMCLCPGIWFACRDIGDAQMKKEKKSLANKSFVKGMLFSIVGWTVMCIGVMCSQIPSWYMYS